VRLPVSIALAALGGCGFDRHGVGSTGTSDDGGAPGLDGGMGEDSSPAEDAFPSGTAHLVLSEIRAITPGPRAEFIEIVNPTTAPVALDLYYLADDDDYFLLPEVIAGGGVLDLDAVNDFVARFPDGATLAPGQAYVVAFDSVAFAQEFGQTADAAIEGGAIQMDVVAGSTRPTLTDAGEGVALFLWDGLTDRITDVDLVLVGDAPTLENRLRAKSGVAIDGPDLDEAASSYAPDGLTLQPTLSRTTPNEAYARLALEDGHELGGGGNGLVGHDETSEDTRATWAQGDFAAPTPGVVPAALEP
jgi:hypothetical protein